MAAVRNLCISKIHANADTCEQQGVNPRIRGDPSVNEIVEAVEQIITQLVAVFVRIAIIGTEKVDLIVMALVQMIELRIDIE